MDILHEVPKSWRDLQDKVGYILASCGYSVEISKKVGLVRGKKEIDVYAESSDISIACECKYWNSRVPQDIVSSFRTVIGDMGVNKGIIVAKEGFQKGAYNVSEKTNVSLYTWGEFLECYREIYIKSMIKRYSAIRSTLYRLASIKSEYQKRYDLLDKNNRIKV